MTSLAASDAHAAFIHADSSAPTQSPATPSVSADPPTPAPEPTAGSSTGNIAAAGEQAKAAATASGATPAQAEAAKQHAIQAMLNGQPYEVPAGLQLPHKRGQETVYFPVEEVLRFHMNHKDYTTHKQRLETQQKEYERAEREHLVRQKALEARMQAFSEERERWEKAYTGEDPEEAERYRRHIELMRSDPHYRQLYEDAIAKRERDAEDEITTELQRFDESREIAHDVADFIRNFGAKHFPDIPAEHIQSLYGQMLTEGTLQWPDLSGRALDDALRSLVPQQVKQLFQREADTRRANAAPFMSEIEQLRAEIAALKGGQTAKTYNDRTRRSIERSRAPVGAPAGGAPPSTGGRRPAQPFPSSELEDRKAAWVRGG